MPSPCSVANIDWISSERPSPWTGFLIGFVPSIKPTLLTALRLHSSSCSSRRSSNFSGKISCLLFDAFAQLEVGKCHDLHRSADGLSGIGNHLGNLGLVVN